MATASGDTHGIGLDSIERKRRTDQELAQDDSIKPAQGDCISVDAQNGVQKVEASTIIWTKWHLVAAYVLIWLIYFITSTQEVVVRLLSPFVTSTFALHSLTATTNVMSSIIGGLSKLPLAKILDTWGRPQGLALSLFVWVIGFIMMAVCRNVQTYAAAQVFSVVGAQAVSYCLTIFIADTSTLKNRPLMLAFATSPYVITTWIGGPINEAILDGPGWRWGFGIWAIITPVVVAPLCLLFFWTQSKAKKAGLIESTGSKKLTLASVKRYIIEVDLLGIIILAGGMALFLLPMSLYSYQGQEWKSPMIISMIIIGGLMLIGFIFYEKYVAPVKFIPMNLLADRTVLGGGFMFLFVFFNSAIWGSYFNSMLLVVWDQGVTKTTYISNIYRVGSCFAALPIGFLIRWTGRFKWVAMYYGMPLMMLGVGLMIYFRQPDQGIGYIVMTQIFVAFAGGPLVIAGEMAMMAPVDHQHVAVVIAILDLFSSIGLALGSTVSAAIWTGLFPQMLEKHLPPGSPIERIYGSIYSQLAYTMGTEIRDGIAKAYGDTQRYMLIASMIALVGGTIAVAFWRDIKLKDVKQVKGTVV